MLGGLREFFLGESPFGADDEQDGTGMSLMVRCFTKSFARLSRPEEKLLLAWPGLGYQAGKIAQLQDFRNPGPSRLLCGAKGDLLPPILSSGALFRVHPGNGVRGEKGNDGSDPQLRRLFDHEVGTNFLSLRLFPTTL